MMQSIRDDLFSSMRIRFLALLVVTGCGGDMGLASVSFPPPFRATNLVDPDIVTASDPTAYLGSTYAGQQSRTMYDRRIGWITVDAFVFDAAFDDGLAIEVQVNPEFGTPEAAEEVADLYAGHMGRLPAALRRDVETVWIHEGRQPFSGFDNSILIHTDQGERYGGFLEETLAHEAAHVSLDPRYAAGLAWRAAQAADPTFVSSYARSHPEREDIAESIVAYLAIRFRADRISADTYSSILGAIPERIAFFDGLGLEMHPLD